jgi:hypothetical protein
MNARNVYTQTITTNYIKLTLKKQAWIHGSSNPLVCFSMASTNHGQQMERSLNEFLNILTHSFFSVLQKCQSEQQMTPCIHIIQYKEEHFVCPVFHVTVSRPMQTITPAW